MKIWISKIPLVKTACVLGLFALALIVWAILDPRPIPVMAAMSIGQVIGTGSLVLFLAALALQTPAKPAEKIQ